MSDLQVAYQVVDDYGNTVTHYNSLWLILDSGLRPDGIETRIERIASVLEVLALNTVHREPGCLRELMEAIQHDGEGHRIVGHAD